MEPTDGYIPKQRAWEGDRRIEKPITLEDAYTTVLVREGSRDVPRKVAMGLPNELNRDGHQQWVDFSDKVPGAHWSSFNGERILVGIRLETWNERDSSDFKGYDRVEARCAAVVTFNNVRVWQRSGRDPMAVLALLPVDIMKLENIDPLISFVTGDETKLIGRPIYYHNQPATIVSFLGEQGSVIIAPVDKWLPRSSDLHELQERYDDPNAQINVEITDSNIWWWRDDTDGQIALSDGYTAYYHTKGYFTLVSPGGHTVINEDGSVKEYEDLTAVRDVVRTEFIHSVAREVGDVGDRFDPDGDEDTED